ncbi:hypothetical protein DNH61_06050 [Paenibacillus sambharensis]|uniref:DUF4303 domain-containing protein n=1 Tax=Paenibacillus sambharensis TaxID=1803190 RepID=A0A2W1LZ20_9BACL|nr:hypothetical protein [Paenibacillus sambharensis]PZD96757.1 hypothetical protein DNH61_06050 [Paenibacillus sambharensis]
MGTLYDVHIGRLLNGKRKLEGEGAYLVCVPGQQSYKVESLEGITGKYISAKDIEDLLYQYCRESIEEFVETEHNDDVYTFSLYTDSSNGSYLVCINNLETLRRNVGETFESYQQQYKESGDDYYNRTEEQVYREYKYAEGDHVFCYEELPGELERVLQVYSRVSYEQTIDEDLGQTYVLDASLIDSQVYLIALKVLERLQTDWGKLNRTEDFIAYVSSSDGDGGDYLTLSTLMRKSVVQDRLYQAVPELREKDEAFHNFVHSVQEKPLVDQVKTWLAVIEGGEFGDNSMRSFSRTDYDAYEQLLLLGKAAVPALEAGLDHSESEDSQELIRQVLEDLK